ncbi:MAG: heme ABC transporter ATP-binding protein [Candidatus Thermoplasmatota archaeon]|nr:heme ABC transporter ATP-binding protein [Candidatus Thermoplasmatota archaeon]
MIRLEDLTFSYNGGPPVLKNIDLKIEKGEMVGILGPNGSGKSTLLRLMSGAIEPSRGRVYLDEKELSRTGRREIAKKMAVVPQETVLGFDFTVREVVSMGRYPHLGRFQFNDPRSHYTIDRAMRSTEVLELSDKSFSKLSGGEKQRTILARALAQEPIILLLDEPTRNLDIRHSLDIMTLVKDMNIGGALTVVVILHDLDLAARFCNRAILLKEGRVHRDGPMEKVLTPEHIHQVFDVRSRVRREEVMRIEVIG